MGNTIAITDPHTGNQIKYVNPFTYDPANNAWVADDVTQITETHFNNLLKYGQAYDPNNIYGYNFYRYDLEGKTGDSVVRLNQEDVLINGFGKDIGFEDFDLYKDLQSGKYSQQLQEGKAYTLSDLQALGISQPNIKGGKDFGDHAQGTDLYQRSFGLTFCDPISGSD